MVEVKNTQNVDLEVGDIFTGKRAGVTFEEVCDFGNLLGFNGKIHTDMEYAKTTPFGGVIVQGLMILAPIESIARRIFGEENWLHYGRLESKYVGMTPLGEEICYRATVEKIEAGQITVSFDCKTQSGKTVIVGQAILDTDRVE